MKIWKIILAVLTFAAGIVLFYESEHAFKLVQIADAFGADVSSITMYAGYIVSILYIIISVLLFVYLNKTDNKGEKIIIVLSIISFVFSFLGPKVFEDLLFLSVCAILCLITAIVSFINNKKSQSGLADLVRHCPYCGAVLNDDSLFCTKCGAEIKEGGTKFCKKCGNERKGTEKFCSKCGTPFEGVPTPSTQNTNHMVQASNSSTNLKIILPIIIGVIILALVGGGWYYWDYSNKKSANEKEIVDSPKLDSQKSPDAFTEATAVKEKENEAISDDANSEMHNFGLHSKYHHHLTGTFEDSSGIYPIELDFNSSGREVSDVIYKNVKVGGKIRMTCTYFDFSSITVKGKDGNNVYYPRKS